MPLPLAQRIQLIRGVGRKLGTKIVVNGQAVPNFNPIVSTVTHGFVTTGLDNPDEQVVAQPTPETEPVGEYGVLAYIYALLLDTKRSTEQLAYLAQVEAPAVIAQIEHLRAVVAIILPHQRLNTLDRQVTKLRDTAHVPRLLKCAYGMVDILPAADWQTAIVYLILAHRLAPTTGSPQELYHSIEDVWVEITKILAILARLSSDRAPDISYRFEASLLRLPTNHHSRAQLPPEVTWREFQTDIVKNSCRHRQGQTSHDCCLLGNPQQSQTNPDSGCRSDAIDRDLIRCPDPATGGYSSRPPTHEPLSCRSICNSGTWISMALLVVR